MRVRPTSLKISGDKHIELLVLFTRFELMHVYNPPLEDLSGDNLMLNQLASICITGTYHL